MQVVKCIVVGDHGVGKTCLLISLATNSFRGDYVPQVADNCLISIMMDGVPINIEFWDTPGQESEDRTRPLAYPNTDVFLACFSVVSLGSFHHIKTKWFKEVRQYCSSVPVILVGTKIDLRDNQGVIDRLSSKNLSPVTYDDGITLAKELGAITYIECSSLEHRGLRELDKRVAYAGRGIKYKKKGCCIM